MQDTGTSLPEYHEYWHSASALYLKSWYNQDMKNTVKVRVYLAGMLVEELEVPGPLSTAPAKGDSPRGTKKGKGHGR